MELNKNTPQFKVGDKVKILHKNNFPANYFPTYVYTDRMLKYARRLATITSVNPYGYKIDLDNGTYLWPTETLQLVTSETDQTVNPHNLKNGDYIKLTDPACEDTLIYLFREVKNNTIYRHAAYSLMDKNINVDPGRHWFVGSATKINYATKEERELLDKALLEQGFVWNDLTKQLNCIDLINVSLVDTYPNSIGVQSVDVSSFRNSIQKVNDVTNLLNCVKEPTQTETELNLFPRKKHYQLNFNY